MPMIATTTRCPSWSASGSSAVTVTSGTSRPVDARPRTSCSATRQLRHRALDDGLQRAVRRLLDQQLGRLPAPATSAPSTSPSVDAPCARRPRRPAPTTVDVDVRGPRPGPPGPAPSCAASPTTPIVVVSPPESSATWRPRVPSSSSEDDDRADDEVLVADAGGDLPGGDQPDQRRAAQACGARSCRHLRRVGAATASRNSSTSVGCCQAKWVTRPVRSAAASTAWSSVSVGELEQGVAGLLGDDADAGQRGGPVRGGVRDDDPQQPAGLAAAQLLDRAGGDHAAAGEDADRVAEPLDEVELVAGEDDRARPARHWSSSASARESTPTGSRPENGSSRMSTSGRLTRAAASWTRCWLPSDSFSTGSPRRSPRPSRSTHSSAARAAAAASRPCSRAK